MVAPPAIADIDVSTMTQPGSRRMKRWVIGIAALVVVLAAVVAAFLLRPKEQPQGNATPLACTLASPAANSPSLSPGKLPAQDYTPPATWRSYEDSSGFRLAVPGELQTSTTASTVCFSDPNNGRYVSVGQWRQTDKNLVDYLNRKESETSGKLSNYHKVSIDPKDYFDGGAEWEFTYDDNGTAMHAKAVALRAGGTRGYMIFWVTKESNWLNNLPDYSTLIGGFRPAQ
jgi:eukaryotic-like serine/threonine-protein kinase